MNPIGGYFSLELVQGNSLHPNALALNTGRNCLEYIIRSHDYRKVYIPYYTCDVVLEPFHKMSVEYEFYHINYCLELAEEISLKDKEALLYTNYFGLKQLYLEQLAKRYGKQLIVDNTQAFYSKPIVGIDTFYSCRKFFGVSDGAYLYTDSKDDLKIEQDVSYDRMSFLLKRLDLGAEAGYADFREQSKRLVGQPIKLMSNLTGHIMQGIDYQATAKIRRNNFELLHDYLADTNLLQLPLLDDSVPLVYPYLSDDIGLKKRLILEKVFVATYWQNVFKWCKCYELEYILAERTAYLPIDQRYGYEEMKRIVQIIKDR